MKAPANAATAPAFRCVEENKTGNFSRPWRWQNADGLRRPPFLQKFPRDRAAIKRAVDFHQPARKFPPSRLSRRKSRRPDRLRGKFHWPQPIGAPGQFCSIPAIRTAAKF